MSKIRLAGLVVLFTAFLMGAFEAPAQAAWWEYPWCMEEYWACVASGTDISDCLCYRQMCMGEVCP